jgi:hypothetical protein
MTEQDPAPEQSWTFRRIFAYAATVINSALLAAIIWKVDDPTALKWLGVSLVASNVVMATIYLAGASVLDWAKLAASWKGKE